METWALQWDTVPPRCPDPKSSPNTIPWKSKKGDLCPATAFAPAPPHSLYRTCPPPTWTPGRSRLHTGLQIRERGRARYCPRPCIPCPGRWTPVARPPVGPARPPGPGPGPAPCRGRCRCRPCGARAAPRATGSLARGAGHHGEQPVRIGCKTVMVSKSPDPRNAGARGEGALSPQGHRRGICCGTHCGALAALTSTTPQRRVGRGSCATGRGLREVRSEKGKTNVGSLACLPFRPH